MKILLIEDHEGVADMVARGLREADFEVVHIANGLKARILASQQHFDLFIVDIMLPGLDGLSLVKAIREGGAKQPILFLSAKRDVEDRVQGLESGGDDYLTKPFAFTELLARVRALLRRVQTEPPADRIVAGEMTLLLTDRVLNRQGQAIPLQNKEFELLRYLMEHAGEIVSKDMIIREVWNYNFNPGTNLVEVRIAALRDKVDRPFGKKSIQTIRGVGYKLVVEDAQQ